MEFCSDLGTNSLTTVPTALTLLTAVPAAREADEVLPGGTVVLLITLVSTATIVLLAVVVAFVRALLHRDEVAQMS